MTWRDVLDLGSMNCQGTLSEDTMNLTYTWQVDGGGDSTEGTFFFVRTPVLTAAD